MVRQLKRRWQLNKVRPGDGSDLPEYRFWQLFTRSLFFLDVTDGAGRSHAYAVDVRLMVDAKSKREHDEAKGKSPASLYRDGVQVARSNLPTTFPVTDGVIEVATTGFGLKRMHFVSETGHDRMLHPHRRSQEGLRARFAQRHPGASAAIGVVTLAILLVALVLALLQGLELITGIPVVAERVGTFDSPVNLPAWANTTVAVAAFCSGLERATRLRYNWLIDSAAT